MHGLASNQKTWSLVQARLGGAVSSITVDLRGRGESSGLPGPFGVATHAADLLAVLDHFRIDSAVMVGHSMGAFVVTGFGALYPERLAGAVLVDGGVEMKVPRRATPEQALEAVIGPVIERLGRRFRRREDCLSHWRLDPAFSSPGQWNETMAECFAYDLGGTEPALSSRINPEAVEVDGAEMFLSAAVAGAGERLECPTELVLAQLGPAGEPEPLVLRSAAAALAAVNDQVRVSVVPSVNHHTLVLTPPGADALVAAVGRLSGLRPVGP